MASRVSQHVVEVLTLATATARVSQHVTEVLTFDLGTAQLSQVVAEVLRTGTAVPAALSQVVLEVLWYEEPAMPNLILWSSPDAIETPQSTGLNSLANNARAISASISSTRDQYADAELYVTYGTAPSSTGYVALYLIPSLDETNFADGDASIVPSPAMQVGTFMLQASTSAQRIILRTIVVPPFPYKWLIWNRAGQAMAASGNLLRTRTYSPEVQ